MPVFRSSVLLLLACFQGVSVGVPLTLVGTIPLPAVEGRIDHLAIDLAHERLFVAALENSTVEVIDLRQARVLRSLRGFNEPQGIAIAPDMNMVAVANGGTGRVQLVDSTDFHIVHTVPFPGDADNVRYDGNGRFYVGYGNGALGVIDPANGSRIANTPLRSHPESFQLEHNGERIFINVPDAGHVAVVDRREGRVISTWPTTGAVANYPMALNESAHRLFIGCRQPARTLVLDTSSGRTVASFDITGDTDDLFFDQARERVYVSGGEGFLDVIQQQPGDRFMRIAHLPTSPGARTSLFVPEQSILYLAVPRRGSTVAQIRMYEAH